MLGSTSHHLKVHRKDLVPFEIVSCPWKCSDYNGMVFIEENRKLEDSKASFIYRSCKSKLINSLEIERGKGSVVAVHQMDRLWETRHK